MLEIHVTLVTEGNGPKEAALVPTGVLLDALDSPATAGLEDRFARGNRVPHVH
jgi:hypothetical protein